MLDIYSSVDIIEQKNITLSYKSIAASLYIGSCIVLPRVIGVIEKCEILNVKKSIKAIYSRVAGQHLLCN